MRVCITPDPVRPRSRRRAAMRRSLVIALALLALAPAAPASGITVVDRHGRPMVKEQRWADRSTIPLPDLKVVLTRGCKGYAGLYYPGDNRVCVDESYNDVLLHELWHLVDYELSGTPAWQNIRRRFLRLHDVRRKDGSLRDWDEPFGYLPYDGVTIRAEEWFADAAAYCSVTPRREWRYESRWLVFEYRFRPRPWRWLRTCRLLDRRVSAAIAQSADYRPITPEEDF